MGTCPISISSSWRAIALDCSPTARDVLLLALQNSWLAQLFADDSHPYVYECTHPIHGCLVEIGWFPKKPRRHFVARSFAVYIWWQPITHSSGNAQMLVTFFNASPLVWIFNGMPLLKLFSAVCGHGNIVLTNIAAVRAHHHLGPGS